MIQVGFREEWSFCVLVIKTCKVMMRKYNKIIETGFYSSAAVWPTMAKLCIIESTISTLLRGVQLGVVITHKKRM